MIWGSGEVRTREQQIKRNRWASKLSVNNGLQDEKMSVQLTMRLLFGAKFEVLAIGVSIPFN
jgi:hypothetical protein